MIYWIRKEVCFRKMEKLVKVSHYAAAHALLDELLKSNANDVDVHMQKAWIFLEEKHYEQVLNYLKALPQASDNPVLLMLQGEASYYLGKLDDAEQLLLKSLALAPDNLRTEYSLGLIHVAKGDFLHASKWFENSVKYDKNLVQTRLLTMAEHYLHVNKFGRV